MPECVPALARSRLGEQEQLDREFEARLLESSTLAFRVAFGVLRQRQDAEDVAQEAFVKAHRSFRQLRDRERFRAWLVRMTWRLALNRQRADRRRVSRELIRAGPPTMPTPVELVASRERAALLWQAIDTLPDKLRVSSSSRPSKGTTSAKSRCCSICLMGQSSRACFSPENVCMSICNAR
jgi:RNA polymerase sigma factor (sigma-70 family)